MSSESIVATERSGGDLIVSALEQQGVKRIFCVPGESYLDVLNSLHDSGINSIVCRQEGGAAMMAEATGKLNGSPGICLVTRGPGATNASAGVHIAAQDSTPMILLIGQINSRQRHREAFQEVDYRQFFSGMAKWVAEIDDVDRVPEMMSRAFHVATSGRPGPVVLALPENMLTGTTRRGTASHCQPVETWPGKDQMQSLQDKLAAAQRPMVILGGSGWDRSSVEQMTGFIEAFDLPVATSFRRQMLFDHLHPNYAGDLGLGVNPDVISRIQSSDLLLVVGARLPEIASQNYTLLDIPDPQLPLVHVHPGAEELGRIYHPALAIHASPRAFCASLETLTAPQTKAWSGSAMEAHTSYLEWSSLERAVPEGALMSEVFGVLGEQLPTTAILTNGAGNYAAWIHRFWRFREFGTQVAPTSGSMGYGLPAAIAAKLECPDNTVIAFAGDGCYQMTMQEFGTAVQCGANVIVLVIDNGMYGTIRMHQEMHYPGRVSATDIVNPDFAKIAQAYDCFGTTVQESGEFLPAFTEAQASGGPALIHVKVNPAAITPTKTIKT